MPLQKNPPPDQGQPQPQQQLGGPQASIYRQAAPAQGRLGNFTSSSPDGYRRPPPPLSGLTSQRPPNSSTRFYQNPLQPTEASPSRSREASPARYYANAAHAPIAQRMPNAIYQQQVVSPPAHQQQQQQPRTNRGNTVDYQGIAGVMTGQTGGGYGPYSPQPPVSQSQALRSVPAVGVGPSHGADTSSVHQNNPSPCSYATPPRSLPSNSSNAAVAAAATHVPFASARSPPGPTTTVSGSNVGGGGGAGGLIPLRLQPQATTQQGPRYTPVNSKGSPPNVARPTRDSSIDPRPVNNTGAVGGGGGRRSSFSWRNKIPMLARSSDSTNDLNNNNYDNNNSNRNNNSKPPVSAQNFYKQGPSSTGSHSSQTHLIAAAAPPSGTEHSQSLLASASSQPAGEAAKAAAAMQAGPAWTAKDAELDDRLHNLSEKEDVDSFSCSALSLRGWLNMGMIIILVSGLLMLFAGFPILNYYQKQKLSTYGAVGLGGTNSSGQVPAIPGLPTLIDSATPSSALTRTGFDGEKYILMFSDEFETDGRTFWPGDDPFWEAVDLHYWATGDYEWYDPDAVTTKDGKLVITISEEPIHNLHFRSGMLQSWNKFCFTGGYIEVSVSLPGSSEISGFWPGAWTLGNLARAGYGATTDGLWPYSYDSCDVGTLPNQTMKNGSGPSSTYTSGLSSLPGQRLSACSCKGADHPGPNVGVGRGAPEIDILEAQISYRNQEYVGTVSQSAQFAPFDNSYYPVDNTSASMKIYDPTKTYINDYVGGVYQEAVSAVSTTDQTAYELSGAGFSKYGWEAFPDRTNGHITWSVGDDEVWTMESSAIAANPNTQVGQRIISEEPMSIILNLGLSASFQTIMWDKLTLPAHMLVDYVRVYQREDSPNLGCDPPNMPTADYINRHMNAYTNPNLTTWKGAGYTFPKNSLNGC